jgi:hypothetical protein
MTQYEHMGLSNFMGSLARDAYDAGCTTKEEALEHVYGKCERYKHDLYLQRVLPTFFMIECIKRGAKKE